MDEKMRELVGKGYDDFWDFKGRYRVVKGGRASKKSKTAALWFIHNMMQPRTGSPSSTFSPEDVAKTSEIAVPNLLVIRKTYNSLRNSCFAELKWAIDRLGATDDWKIKTAPLEMSYSGGGSIYFRGLDNSMKLTSITADKGKLCWVWIEEAFEIDNEDDFNMIDESIRGRLVGDGVRDGVSDGGGGLFKQITLTFNPWSDTHWLKKRFFDRGAPGGMPTSSEATVPDKDILAITTDYTCNEWLDESDIQLFEQMKADNPKRFKVAGLGDWGVADGLVFNNWEVREFSVRDLLRTQLVNSRGEKRLVSAFGLDFGYTNDPSAFCCMLVDTDNRYIYVFDEMYGYGMSNRDIYTKINLMGYRKEKIFADSAEPKSIDELYCHGLSGIRKARKGPDSVNHGIQFIQGYKVIIHPNCDNFFKEISTYSFFKNSLGVRTNAPAGGFDHLMDAMRYGLSEVSGGERFGF